MRNLCSGVRACVVSVALGALVRTRVCYRAQPAHDTFLDGVRGTPQVMILVRLYAALRLQRDRGLGGRERGTLPHQ